MNPAFSSDIALTNDDQRVVVRPARGTDIVSWVDLRSGVDVLFHTPWDPSDRLRGGTSTSEIDWMASYSGGWQLLFPNAGASNQRHGVEWGFHGEASVAQWVVEDVGDTWMTATTALFHSPFRITRSIELVGTNVRIQESILNNADQAIDCMWGHHPAFGRPLLAAGARIWVPGREFLVDDSVDPDGPFQPGSQHPWPVIADRNGTPVDLSTISSADGARQLLGYVTGLDADWFAVTNDQLQLGAAITWSSGVDAIWLWQDFHGSRDFPFYGRAYVTAVEPQSTVRGQWGLSRAILEGDPILTIEGGETRTFTVEGALLHYREPCSSLERVRELVEEQLEVK